MEEGWFDFAWIYIGLLFGFLNGKYLPVDDMYQMIRKIEFTNVGSDFQKKLQSDVQSIQSSNKLFVFADKSTNLCELTGDHYEKFLHNNITQTCKKANAGEKLKINKESKKFAKSLNLNDKMECYSDQCALITLKDHKENSKSDTKCRLINPSKSEVGLVSKTYLNDIIVSVSLFILIKKTLQGLQALQPKNNTKLIIKRNNS